MNEVVHTSPTIGSNVEEIVVKNTHFLMWDIGGQESLRSSWNTYYSNTEVSRMFAAFFFSLYLVIREGRRGIVRGSWRVCFAAQTAEGAAQVKGRLLNNAACLKSKTTGRVQRGTGRVAAEADVNDDPGG